MKLFLSKGTVLCSVLVNDMFPKTAQTQQKVIHSVSHSAFNVLNILMGMRYIME